MSEKEKKILETIATAVPKMSEFDKDKLRTLYERNMSNIWVGFNNRHYDQYIMKGILLGLDPKKINDWIIIQGKEGWQYSRVFNKLPMINYDVMPNPPVGLKTMEGFMGSNIKETEVPFDIKRKLTEKEIEQTVFYCRHDVEEPCIINNLTTDTYSAIPKRGIHKALHKMQDTKIYAALIIKGVKTMDDVPDKLKDAVKAILEGGN